MRILLELEKLKDPYSGLGQFCAHLSRALVEGLPADATLTAYLPANKVGFLGNSIEYKAIGRLDRFLPVRNQDDVWHNTHQEAAYWPTNRATPTVLTVHDLNFLERPDYGPAKKRRKLRQHQRQIDRADAVVAISEYTAGQSRKHLSLGTKAISVIPNGCPPLLPPERQEALPEANRPFVLGLGVMHPKKNWSVLLPLIQRFPDLNLVLAGSDRHAYADGLRQQVKDLKLEKQVRITGPVSEARKAWLLQNCEALWFPSLSEGFGIPPIEAMSAGKPVFLSNLTSLPEIGGEAACYWDSFDPERMADVFERGMAEYRQNPARREELRQRAALFSWEKAASAYWQLYRSLATS